MKKINKDDYLDILRYLNDKNINDSQKLKDEFFEMITTNYEFLPTHIKELSDAWAKEITKGYTGPAKDYLSGYSYSTEISRQLTDFMIEDRICSLYLNEREGHYTLTYIGAIKGIKELIERYPSIFDTFKNNFLLGLITRYSHTLGRTNEKKERFNKLVNIYIESQLQSEYNVELEEEISSYIDEEFIDEVNKVQKEVLNLNKMQSILNQLLQRKSKKYETQRFTQKLEELKDKYSNASTYEEKNQIIEEIEELYRTFNYFYDSESYYYQRRK